MIALITSNVLNRAFQKEKAIGKGLKEYGIERVKGGKGTLSQKDRNIVFGLRGYAPPSELCLCFITGSAFFRDFQSRAGYIEGLASRGCNVRVLLANPNQSVVSSLWDADTETNGIPEAVVDYYYNLLITPSRAGSFLERTYTMLASSAFASGLDDEEHCKRVLRERLRENKDHIEQVRIIQTMLSEAAQKADHGGSISLHYYVDEYQMPIIMAKFDAGDKQPVQTLVWTNMNAPIRETIDSINIFALHSEDSTSGFADDVEKSFEYLWRAYPKEMLSAAPGETES